MCMHAGNMEVTLNPSTATETPTVTLQLVSAVICCAVVVFLIFQKQVKSIMLKLINKMRQKSVTGEGLSDKLYTEGLDGRYWSDILTHHKVNTLEQLTALSGDDFAKILSNARYESELEKMKELTGHRTDLSLSSKTRVSYRLENISSYIEELLTDAGNDENLEFVKVKLSKLYNILGVHDNEWPDVADKDQLNIFLTKLQKEVCLLKQIQESIELRSDNTLVTEASGGLSLTGVLVRCGKVVPGKRNPVIQCPTILSLHPCPEFDNAINIGFTYKQQEEDFYGLVNSGFSKLAIENLQHNQHTIAQSSSQIMFTTYMTSQFTLHSKELTDKALETLEKIDTDLSSSIDEIEIAEKCMAFFQSFGSHISNSSICLGAYSIAENQYEGHSASELIAEPVTHGGVGGVTIPAIWRLGLVNDCRTWKVIDRGVIDDMTGVWSLVETHCDSLKNPQALSKVLKKTWEDNFRTEDVQNSDQGAILVNVESISKTDIPHQHETIVPSRIGTLDDDQPPFPSITHTETHTETIIITRTVQTVVQEACTSEVSETSPKNKLDYEEHHDEKNVPMNVGSTTETDNQHQSDSILKKSIDALDDNLPPPLTSTTQSKPRIEPEISEEYIETDLRDERCGKLEDSVDGKHDAEQNMRVVSSQSTRISVHRRILDKLHITKYHPCKLTLQKLSHVHINGEEPTLAHIILKKILCCDSSGRDSEVDSLNNTTSSSILTTTADILAAFDDDSECDDQLNALDVFLAIYSCCDMLLKKAVCEKLFICKQAIPLIFPNVEGSHFTYGLWTLRQIAVDYHDMNGKTFQTSLATQPLRIISCLRFGNCHMSKSKMLNDLLTEQQHDTFFHRDCPSGDVKSALSQGLVDASLYLPSGKGSDRFEETLAFLNLHGDCLTASVPSNFLISVSDTILALMPLDSLKQEKTVMELQTMAASRFVIMIVAVPPTSDDRRTKEILAHFLQQNDKSVSNNIKMIFTRHRGKEKGAASLTTELVEHIRNKTPKMTQSFEYHAEKTKQPPLMCDEESEPCKSMKKTAQSIMKDFNGKDLVTCKKDLLPLQGQLWKQWSNLQRKQHGMKGSIGDQNNIYLEKKKLRQEQAKKFISPMMNKFIDALVKHDAARQIYFLQWLQIYLDEKSRRDLPEFKSRWHNLKLNLEKRKREKNIEQQELSDLQKEVDAAELKFVEASIGIEHFFREIGQIYEVSRENVSYDSEILSTVNQLPSLVAKMLLAGSTFEIMDGDAANIPLTWIQAVFKELVTILGDKHVFVLSVIGIQSSGKSTMLNAMFGLCFSVSAGRCTRGLFMKILPVSHSKEGAYDYMLVVDTEGLRSQEALSQMHRHDNMLTTLVIGIADLTLVNIKGENQSEIKDVLQIAVHAFLKMKLANSRIKLQQKCVFVHQNVPAVDAGSNLSHAQIRMVDDLNEMTKAAAESEGICDIDRFEEVIEFRAQTGYDLWYFSDCWQGDPPMAPSNPGYSAMVMKCRKTILENVVQNDTYFRLSDFSIHLSDIWNGALSLDFVFSFRNSLEIKSNNIMEKTFRVIIGEIEKKISKWMRDEMIKIGRCETEDDLSTCIPDSILSLRNKIRDCHSIGKKDLDEFFKTNNLRTITAQWESHKQKTLQHSCSDLARECETKLYKMKKSKILDLLQQDKVQEQRATITKKAIEAGTKLKDVPMSDGDLEVNFGYMWKELEQEFESTLSSNTPDINTLCRKRLYSHFKDQQNLISEEWPQVIEYNDIMNVMQYMELNETYISVPKRYFAKIRKKPDWNPQITEITRNILENVGQKINAVRQRMGDIEATDIEVLLNTVTIKVDEHNMDSKNKFTLLPSYTVKLAEYVTVFAAHQFRKVHNNFEKEHGIIAKLKKYRETAFNIFVNTAKRTKDELMTAQFVSHIITPKIEDMLHHDLQTQLTNLVLASLGSMKGQLIINMLNDLADKKGFLAFISYIMSPSTFAETWIRELFERFTSRMMTSDSTVYVAETRSILKRIILSIEKAMGDLSGDLEEWVIKFCENTSKELILTKQDFQEIIDSQKSEQTKMDKLSQHVIDLLPGIEKSILSKYEKHIISEVTWKEPVPYKEIFDKIWGCKEVCPFCREPCMNPDSRHHAEGGTSHHTIQHKPDGCRGAHWKRSNKLGIEPCNYSVTTEDSFTCSMCRYNCRKLELCEAKEDDKASHPFKKYKKYVPEWDIAPNPLIDSCKYWMWFMCTFEKELVKHFSLEKPDIPEAWRDIDVEAAKESLRLYYNG